MRKCGIYRKLPIYSLLFLIFASCTDKEYVTNYDRQKTSLKSYMETLQSGYVILDDDVYVSMLSDRSEPNAAAAKTGDTVSIYYAEYILQGSSLGSMIWTNREEWTDQNNPQPEAETDFSPQKIVIGDRAVIAGLDTGLKGSKKGQEFMIAMPFTEAYGDKWVSTVPPYSAIAFRVLVENIYKKD